MRIPYAISFAVIGADCFALAFMHRGWWRLAAWPGVSFLVVAAAYAGGGPRWFGKGAGGRFAPWAWLLLGPFILFTWLTWHAARLLSREPAGHEVAPSVWVGRRAARHELPPDVRLVVDLTCEMWAPGGLARNGESYVCSPTLDGTAPADELIHQLLDAVAASPGAVYIHCAQGRGRSAALAAALLIARGAAADVDDAEAVLRKARPSVRLNAIQRRWVARISSRFARVENP
jgi:protein-tyrosine phosphatase